MIDHRTLCGLYFLREDIKAEHKKLIRDAVIDTLHRLVPRG